MFQLCVKKASSSMLNNVILHIKTEDVHAIHSPPVITNLDVILMSFPALYYDGNNDQWMSHLITGLQKYPELQPSRYPPSA